MNDMVTYWVSFATDEAFLGVTIVDMEEDDADIVNVVKKTIEVGANPGDGSVQMQKLHERIPERYKNRLLSSDEAKFLMSGGHLN